VAACYEAKGGPTNLRKAEGTLAALKKSKDFYSCLPPDKHELVSQQWLGIQAKKHSTL
jgi:hypothetical protein